VKPEVVDAVIPSQPEAVKTGMWINVLQAASALGFTKPPTSQTGFP